LVIHYRPNDMQQPRVGFVVAKKVAKLAVDRNYMRRVLRELCREELHALHGVDVVIQVKKPFKNKHFFSLKQELATLFVKIQNKLAQDKTSA
jgi:ribonuclease P protein component